MAAEPVLARPAQGQAFAGRVGLAAWCAYDWANSAFPTVITTFVFAAYFAKAVAIDDVTGTSQWAYAMSASAFALALAGPVLGAIADSAGRRKPWVGAFTVVAVLASGMLWFAKPDPAFVLWTLVFAAIANFAFEMAGIFYNAMLPSLASPAILGRISGWGWGLGYVGGLTCLVVALVLLVQPDPPLFGLDADAAEPVRATALLVAIWIAFFSLPFFLFTPDTRSKGVPAGVAVRQGLASLLNTFRRARDYKPVLIYLLSHMIYTDGLNTLFTVGGIYAAVTFGMSFNELLIFGIAMNVTAGLGAFAFGWIDDWIGPKTTIFIAVGALTVLGAILIVVESKTLFWVFGLPLGIFFGPAQVASRSLMARLAPPNLYAEMFGLLALSGKATAFLGPLLFGLVTGLTGSQRWGLATILGFFVVGLALLIPVPNARYVAGPPPPPAVD
ncbi:MAG: MFS transporter [Rhodospirillales bacterium]